MPPLSAPPQGSARLPRLSDTTGESDAIIANGSAEGPAIVKIKDGDKAFQSAGCEPWAKID